MDIGGFEFNGAKGSSYLVDHFCSFLSGGGKIGFKAKVVVLVLFYHNEMEPLGFSVGIHNVKEVIVGYTFWMGSVCCGNELTVDAGVLW